jgi:protoheme IX farnesyltransferase
VYDVCIVKNSSLVNLFVAWQFHQYSDSGTSRRLFRFSLIHLPLLMVMMLLTKKQKGPTSNRNDVDEVISSSFC